MNDIEKIKMGVVTSTTNHTEDPGYTAYRTCFLGKNFFVYRIVRAGDLYRGEKHEQDGLVLAWADYAEYAPTRPPNFIPLK